MLSPASAAAPSLTLSPASAAATLRPPQYLRPRPISNPASAPHQHVTTFQVRPDMPRHRPMAAESEDELRQYVHEDELRQYVHEDELNVRHHVRSCPLKKKQKGRPQAQTHIQPQVEEIPLPKKNQANAPIVEKSSEKKEKKQTCYICREKGHISSFCTIGTSSNSISIDDVYSLCKDEGGNVFAKYVGAQSGVKKEPFGLPSLL
ncbi:hypothetical protein QYE76_037413 [Lolium multiflorum]|uniref:CCHC-type domain-containing protein n=1 Tax=Lolium multiflorum TaxID=4521 RepID=A0AAD8VE19_LOLMU|nr:hypothetical protein QYE76_037413 [Lolium multiflorum]